MTSTNNALNNGATSDSSCIFDKNEFYEENGMIQSQKKNRKSHGKTAANQMEARQNKLTTPITNSLPVVFPLTYDGLLQWHQNDTKATSDPIQQPVATSPGKVKNTHLTKLFYNRNHLGQSAKQELLCNEYDEELLAEEDALEEAYEVAYEKNEKLRQEYLDEHEEEQYQAYLEKRYLWDFPENEDLSIWDLQCLKDDIDKYEAEMTRTTEVEDISRTMTLSEYDESITLWKKYGLTKDQYDANLAYENNRAKLSAYYSDPDYANHPEYGMRLEADIKKYENDFDMKTLKDVENEDNAWWMTSHCLMKEEEEEEYNYALDSEPLDIFEKWREARHEHEIEGMIQESIKEEEEEAEVSYEDWCENKRDQDFEDWRQEMIDDRDD
jgi:hypothetical protein